MIELTQIVGFVAGAGTTFAALPDLIAMLKRRSSDGMNPRMAAILGTFQILWVIYGVSIGSKNIIMWNVIAIVTNYLTVGHTRTFVADKGNRNHRSINLRYLNRQLRPPVQYDVVYALRLARVR
jgi:MtN3 and saliva related transmembrane protein